jgi:hypothetical protein
MKTQPDQSRDPLYTAASLIKHAVSADDERFNLNHFYYDGKGSLVATDSHRLATVAVDLGSEPFMFRSPVNGAWKAWKTGQFKPTLIKNTDDAPNACQFPDWAKAIPKTYDIDIKLSAMELLQVNRFYGHRLDCRLTTGNLNILDVQGARSFREINLPVDYDGQDLYFTLNRAYVSEEVQNKGSKLTIKTQFPEKTDQDYRVNKSFVFTYGDHPEYTGLVMPMRPGTSSPVPYSRDDFARECFLHGAAPEKEIYKGLGETAKVINGVPRALIRQWIKDLLNEGLLRREGNGDLLVWQGPEFDAPVPTEDKPLEFKPVTEAPPSREDAPISAEPTVAPPQEVKPRDGAHVDPRAVSDETSKPKQGRDIKARRAATFEIIADNPGLTKKQIDHLLGESENGCLTTLENQGRIRGSRPPYRPQSSTPQDMDKRWFVTGYRQAVRAEEPDCELTEADITTMTPEPFPEPEKPKARKATKKTRVQRQKDMKAALDKLSTPLNRNGKGAPSKTPDPSEQREGFIWVNGYTRKQTMKDGTVREVKVNGYWRRKPAPKSEPMRKAA